MRPSFEEKPCKGCKGTGKVTARTKSGQGRMAKNKGSATELRVAKMIATAIGVPYEECRRTPNSGALIERGDLRLSDRALERFPWFVEVKAREAWDFHQLFSVKPKPGQLHPWEPEAWYWDAQLKSKSDAKNGFGNGKQYPVLLILLQNHKEPLAMCIEGHMGYFHAMFPKIRIGDFSIVKLKDVLKRAADNLQAATDAK